MAMETAISRMKGRYGYPFFSFIMLSASSSIAGTLCCVLRDVVVLIHTKQHEEKRETTKFERKN
jgi:hypothetical protein